MRKGYLLAELICVLALTVAVSLVLNRVFKIVVGDIPRMQNVVNENGYIQNILARLQRDVDAAGAMKQDFSVTDPNYLGREPIIIELSDRTVCYRQKDRELIRQIIQPFQPPPTDPNEPDPTKIVWPLEKAKIKWRVWERSGAGYALEVRTHFEYEFGSTIKSLLANSRVFFLKAHPQPSTEK